MVHSGSRNLGYKVAKHYNEVAVKLNAKWHTSVPTEYQLAFLPFDSQEGKDLIFADIACSVGSFINPVPGNGTVFVFENDNVLVGGVALLFI